MASPGGDGGHGVVELRTGGLREAHVTDHATLEERLLAQVGAIDELVDDDEVARGDPFPQRAHRRHRQQAVNAELPQGMDVRPRIDLARAESVIAAMPGQEDHLHPIDETGDERPRRRAERGVHHLLGAPFEALEIVETAAAEDAQRGPGARDRSPRRPVGVGGERRPSGRDPGWSFTRAHEWRVLATMKREPARMSETFTQGSKAGPGNQPGQAPAPATDGAATDSAATDEPVEDDPVAALVRQGEHPAAARLAVGRGELTRAIAIYQRLWRYADALPLALELGDTGLAIELALDAGLVDEARRLAEGIPREDRAGLVRSAALFARRGAHHEAGQLAERAQDWKVAAEAYRRAGDHLEVGRMEEADGRLRQAGVAYELALETAGDAHAAARADEALGRLLGRLGQHRQAAGALQRAARDPRLRPGAERALLAELVALDLPAAATALGARIHRTHPGHPRDPTAILALDRAEQAARQRDPLQGPRPGPEREAGAEGGLVQRRFRVLRLLGAGATSQVFLAEDTLLGHEIALKLLVVGTHAAGAERLAYQRFAREAEAVGRLRHPNIVALYDADASAGMFVMEYLPGGTLADRLARAAPLAPGVVRRLGLDLLSALTVAHDHGLVHRDVKPANILFDVAGNAKLADFGAAHLADFGQTQTGGLMGTVAYMSPEQITGSGIGPAADLYAAGVTLFEALTGQLPFPGPDIVAQHLGEPAPAPSGVRAARGGAGKLDARHDAVLWRALEKDPAQRFASAEEMAEAIRGWPESGAESGPEFGLLAAAVAPRPGLEPPGGPAISDAARTEELRLGRSASGGTLYRRHDPRLERTVLVERRTASLDEDPAALQRVRNLASAGGPMIQRVLGISPDGHAIVYEWIDGPRVAIEDLEPPWGPTMAQLAASLAADLSPDAASNVDHGSPGRSGIAAITAAGPVLLVCEPRDDPGEP